MLGLQFPVDGFYMHSFEIWLATTVVFYGSGNIGFTLLEYRLGEKSLVSSPPRSSCISAHADAGLCDRSLRSSRTSSGCPSCTCVPTSYAGTRALTTYRPQLLLLRRALDPRVAGDPRALPLVQHDVGRDKEGGRAVKLLQGGAPDIQAPLVPVDALLGRPCGYCPPEHAARAVRVPHRRRFVGRDLPPRVCGRMPHSDAGACFHPQSALLPRQRSESCPPPLQIVLNPWLMIFSY